MNPANSGTKIIVNRRAQTCQLLCNGHSASKTHVRDTIFKLSSINASVIYQIPWIRWNDWIQWKFCSFQEKLHGFAKFSHTRSKLIRRNLFDVLDMLFKRLKCPGQFSLWMHSRIWNEKENWLSSNENWIPFEFQLLDRCGRLSSNTYTAWDRCSMCHENVVMTAAASAWTRPFNMH